jgi:chromosome segregation protein
MAALEVGRLDMVRALPAMRRRPNWPSTARPARRCPEAAGALPRLADLLRLNDAGQKALLSDWLQGCYTAPAWKTRWPSANKLQSRRSHLRASSGHAVTAHSVSFYAPDSEQAGLLARAQEIENLDKQLRAQALISEEARAPWSRPRPPTADASSAWCSRAARSREPSSRAHELQVETCA